VACANDVISEMMVEVHSKRSAETDILGKIKQKSDRLQALIQDDDYAMHQKREHLMAGLGMSGIAEAEDE